ncbi:hypothetical protein CASFOL_039013 [Castilleja foliolosa]|uniref:DNA-directed RNA polymerase n=1 Tax=Castilleja foliolosa TaxID=1961234 RepID=A0ABD3BH67_9LAMI
MAAQKISHPPMDQLQGLEDNIDSNPSWGESIVLGFQPHYILALETAIMIPYFVVPLMGGNDMIKYCSSNSPNIIRDLIVDCYRRIMGKSCYNLDNSRPVIGTNYGPSYVY